MKADAELKGGENSHYKYILYIQESRGKQT